MSSDELADELKCTSKFRHGILLFLFSSQLAIIFIL